MATYKLNPVDGLQHIKSERSSDLYHDVALRANNATSGTVTIKARKSGSDVFESIPDGTLDLSSLNTIQFTGSVAEYQIEISGIAGITSLYLTDTSQGA